MVADDEGLFNAKLESTVLPGCEELVLDSDPVGTVPGSAV